MSRVFYLGLIATLSAFHTPPALADTAADEKAYLASPETREAARVALKTAAEQVMPACATYSADDASTVVYKNLRLRNGRPEDGLFRESATVHGCGTSRRISVLGLVRPDGNVQRVALLPGTTLGDPIVQRDAIPYAISGAAKRIPAQCHDVRVKNTDFIGYDPATIENKKPWREIWTVSACQATIAVDMLFRPDSDGTTIIARPHKP